MGAGRPSPPTGLSRNSPTKGSRTIRLRCGRKRMPRTVQTSGLSPQAATLLGQVCREAWSAIEGPQL